MSPDLPLRLGIAAARRMAPLHPELDDLGQEAALRVALVAAEKPDASTAYLAGAARMRVRDLLRGKPWTGQDGTQHAPRDPLRHSDRAELDADSEGDVGAPEDGFDVVEWATLAPELDEAIRAIPIGGSYGGVVRETPRDVARLVMAGLTPSQAGRRLGLTDTAGRKAWADTARPHLAADLSHLKELVS